MHWPARLAVAVVAGLGAGAGAVRLVGFVMVDVLRLDDPGVTGGLLIVAAIFVVPPVVGAAVYRALPRREHEREPKP